MVMMNSPTATTPNYGLSSLRPVKRPPVDALFDEIWAFNSVLGIMGAVQLVCVQHPMADNPDVSIVHVATDVTAVLL